MSLHKELKAIDPVLRAAYNRRADHKKQVRKHRANKIKWAQDIVTLQERLEKLTESTWRKVERLTDRISTEEVTLVAAIALHREAEEAYETRLTELGAIGLDDL